MLLLRCCSSSSILLLFISLGVAAAEALQPGMPPQVAAGNRPERIREAREGTVLKLKCPLVSPEPFHIEWMKDGERIDPTIWSHHTISGKHEQHLRVKLVSSSGGSGGDDGGSGDDRSGLYTCKGVNGFGTATYGFLVTVKGRYEGGTELLQSTLRDVRVHESDNFSLTCAVRNPGEIDMRWLKRVEEETALAATTVTIKLDDGSNYRQLKETMRHHLSERTSEDIRYFTLSVQNVTKEDSGLYACLVINSLVKLDKTFRYNKALITVVEKTIVATAAAAASGQINKPNELTILVIVLPVVLVFLVVVLLLIVRKNRRDKSEMMLKTKTILQQQQQSVTYASPQLATAEQQQLLRYAGIASRPGGGGNKRHNRPPPKKSSAPSEVHSQPSGCSGSDHHCSTQLLSRQQQQYGNSTLGSSSSQRSYYRDSSDALFRLEKEVETKVVHDFSHPRHQQQQRTKKSCFAVSPPPPPPSLAMANQSNVG